MTFTDGKQRFSNRVADYVRYRPGYPDGLIDILRHECGLQRYHQVADIGSGTGILSKLLVRNGNFVWGVEPNQEMGEASEEFLASYSNFVRVPGSAEASTLGDSCIDFITVGQAFHWFEPVGTRKEFLRILKPQGWTVIMWNDRRLSETAFGRAYEELLVRFGTDYTRVKEAYPEMQDMQQFFGEGNFQRRELGNFQELDFNGLAGRVRSSSYAPKEGHANYIPMTVALRELFDANHKSGRVCMEYTTQIYFGRLAALRNSA